MDIKYQTVNFVLPAGTVAGIHSVSRTELTTGYEFLTGIATYVNLNPQVEFQIAIKDDNNTYQDFTNYRDFVASQSLDFHKRYKPFRIQSKGTVMKLEIKVLTTLSNSLNLDFVFRLEKQASTNCQTQAKQASTKQARNR